MVGLRTQAVPNFIRQIQIFREDRLLSVVTSAHMGRMVSRNGDRPFFPFVRRGLFCKVFADLSSLTAFSSPLATNLREEQRLFPVHDSRERPRRRWDDAMWKASAHDGDISGAIRLL